MAMTKEQQAEAARRILEKEPLTEEEGQVAELLKRVPGMYTPPTREGLRVCGICGATFEGEAGTKEKLEVTSLQQFVEHQADHNPSPAQWTEAHNKIQAGKQRQKREEEGSR